jgi:copper transporter 1
MLWNWNTVNACFISSTWHVRSKGGFAGSCIGVICLVILLEGLKRLQRGYDRSIIRKERERLATVNSTTEAEDKEDEADIGKKHLRQRRDRRTGSEPGPTSSASSCCQPPVTSIGTTATTSAVSTPTIPFLSTIIQPPSGRPRARLTLIQQTIRAFIHTCQFSVAYFVMLLAMYFNGYIIICIFIGAYIGNFMFSWDVLEDVR